jgi:pyruvate dehydrogenase (quinone)/pyruvate oxidase
MAKTTLSDVLLDILRDDWGVDTIFGIPGDGINGLIEALRKRKDRIRFIQTRHEEAAAFMACAYAKFTRRLGVWLATSGPGGIHLLNGLYDAKFDGAPVLAITGMHYHDLLDTHSQQDVNLDRLFEDVAVYNTRVMGPAHIEAVTQLACKSALAKRGVAHLTIPVDFQDKPMERKQPSPRNKPHHVSQAFAPAAPLPRSEDLHAAADILNSGGKVAILAGQGASQATDELLAVAETLGAPIIKALLGKSSVPDDSVYTTGSIGLLGTRPSHDAIEGCDTLLLVGTSFPYLEFLPKPGSVKGVQIDIEPERLGLRYPVEVGIAGDSGTVLRELLPLLKYKQERSFLSRIQAEMEQWWRLMKDRGTRMDKPMKPQVPAWELGKRMADDAILACDSGTIATWWARQIPARRGQMHSLSGTLATMACGLPYAIAAQVAFPERQVIAFVGDGGLSMLIAELATCVKYKLPVKIVVIKNNTLGQIKWEQMVMLGNPEYVCDLQPVDFVKVAEGFGVRAFSIEDPKSCGEILQRALEVPGPALVECVVDPNEPPLPAKIKEEYARKFGTALIRGEKYRGEIIATITEDQFRETI